MAKRKKKTAKQKKQQKTIALMAVLAIGGYYIWKKGMIPGIGAGARGGNGTGNGNGVLASGSYSFVAGLGTTRCPNGKSGIYIGIEPWARENFREGQRVRITQTSGIGNISGVYTIQCAENPNSPGRPANSGFTIDGSWNPQWGGTTIGERSQGTWQLLS